MSGETGSERQVFRAARLSLRAAQRMEWNSEKPLHRRVSPVRVFTTVNENSHPMPQAPETQMGST